ncbi:hypothetical protein CHS0354_017154 [Potamilus streckersoni]|uniref:Uncharacterized protein n=1 Tax=Potamilus streckersoni TaxID=2493646 RepID=A0AAE0T2P4_9BIVA|nr:hypothetical protein CHS0354_017154 [Potamilus streckersoni]
MCCVANKTDRLYDEEFLSFKIMIHDHHFRVLCDRFNENLESCGRDSFKSIAEGLCSLQDNDSAARQLLLATTNACLTDEKTMLNDFIKM